ncbi:MAG: phosphoribosylamine--glycine ligase [Candidatus Kerfeldbacteria bacterium]
MKVLVIGSGGREAMLALLISLSKLFSKIELFIAPGNAGTAEYGTNVPIKPTEIDKLIEFAKKNKIDLTVVGPEGPLVEGIVDEFREAGLSIFGPNKAAAKMEASKDFAKIIFKKCNIPTAVSDTFDNYAAAARYVDKYYDTFPDGTIVIKADGLAGGKGVIICHNLDEAMAALNSLMLRKAFGGAGKKVVIEEFLVGSEISFMAFYDGKTIRSMIASQDHKQRFEGDTGLMTGGMGAFAPVGWITNEMITDFVNQRILPALKYLEEEYDIIYTGCLYIALMYTSKGFQVLEWNARMGDPETQAVLSLLKSDLLDYLSACADGRLSEWPEFEWQDNKHAVCVSLCEDPYPGSPKGGYEITGLDEVSKMDDITIIHGGTKYNDEGKLVTTGGRVLYIICVADSLEIAQARANKAAELIQFEKKIYRKDIGNRKWPTIVQ